VYEKKLYNFEVKVVIEHGDPFAEQHPMSLGFLDVFHPKLLKFSPILEIDFTINFEIRGKTYI
jgi:hypothetical protein